MGKKAWYDFPSSWLILRKSIDNSFLTIYSGDVIYVSIIGKPIIVLNSAEAARDLFDKRAANYSDRPRFILHGELCVSFSYVITN